GNMDRIQDIADDPLSGLRLYSDGPEQSAPRKLGWLTEAADPIQFVAHCIELVAALKEGEGYETRLPLPFDATNSGAQHYSLLARAPDGARLTNLVYEGKVADLYTDVSKRIEGSLVVHVDDGRKYVRAELEATCERGVNDLAEVESAALSHLPKDYGY